MPTPGIRFTTELKKSNPSTTEEAAAVESPTSTDNQKAKNSLLHFSDHQAASRTEEKFFWNPF